MYNILISGYYGFDNIGDESILRTLVTSLRERIPDCSLTVLSHDPAATREKYGVEAVERMSPLAIARAVRRCDMLISGGGLAVLIHPWENVPVFDFAGIVALVAISVVGSFLAYAFYMQGVKDLGPLRANMLGTSEPISATIFSVLWLGTSFSPTDLIGFAMIITMVYLTA